MTVGERKLYEREREMENERVQTCFGICELFRYVRDDKSVYTTNTLVPTQSPSKCEVLKTPRFAGVELLLLSFRNG